MSELRRKKELEAAKAKLKTAQQAYKTTATTPRVDPDNSSVLSRRARRSKIQRSLANEVDFLKKDSVELLESQLHEVYVWVDEAPITKVKRNLNKDFADGSSIAEVIRHYLPESKKYLVDLSDYQSTVKFKNMKANW